jgi:hypothetical protein
MARPRSNKIIWFFLDYRENEGDEREENKREKSLFRQRRKGLQVVVQLVMTAIIIILEILPREQSLACVCLC